MDKMQIDERLARLARLRARAADVLGEPLDTSDAGGLSQVERAIQIGEAAAFRGMLIAEWSTKARGVRRWLVDVADVMRDDGLAPGVENKLRDIAAEIPDRDREGRRLADVPELASPRRVLRELQRVDLRLEPLDRDRVPRVDLAQLSLAPGDLYDLRLLINAAACRGLISSRRKELLFGVLSRLPVARDAEVKS